MQKLISIDLYADFGMLKKPDTNDPVYLTFNMLHKPALLGILGAIIGLEGFKEKGKLPDYYEKLKDLKVGIEPLKHENGNFQKSTVKYNNATGLANQAEENVFDIETSKIKKKKTGATLNIIEQFLITPAFRCYFLLDTNNELHQKIDDNLMNYHAEFLPYLGKNEFSVWWEDYKEYGNITGFDFSKEYRVGSIFYKNEVVSNHIAKTLMRKELKNRFVYFERLPVAYLDIGKKNYQYDYCDFVFTNAKFNTKLEIDNLTVVDNETIIQLF